MPNKGVDNLENSVLSGIRWNLVLSFAGQFCNIGITLVLSRLLEPADFGMIAAALALVGVVEAFGSLGGSAALTQRSSISDQFYTAVFIVGSVLAVLMMLVIGGFSHFLAAFYGKPDLQKIFIFLSFSIPFQFLETFPLAELQRRLAFERIAIISFFGIIIAGAIALYLAYSGYGWIALVVRLFLLQFIRTAFFCFLAWPKFRFRFGAKEIKELLHFGIPQSFSQFIMSFGRRVDDMLIGRFMGTSVLGIYSLAYSLYTWPIANIKGRISQVVFAALSKVNTDREAMGAYYLKTVSLATLIGFPAIIGFASVCDLAVPVIMGEKWLPAVGVLRILGFASLFEISVFPGAIYQATAKTRTYLKANIFARATTVAGILAGLSFGLTGIATSIVITSFISLFIYNYFVRKLIPVTNLMLFGIMAKNSVFSWIMLAAILLFRLATRGYLLPVVELGFSVAIGATCYGLLIKKFHPEVFRNNPLN